jgi:Cof subfamily protein (haloacid dehalogenase superfamily)
MKHKDKQFLGWIALDMDGTITLDKFSVPAPVVAYLHDRVMEGWKIAIATGRPMTLALMALDSFDFPYIVLAQNGTMAIVMPSKKELFRQYIPKSRLREIELAFEGTEGDFVVFNGYDHGDKLYWRPERCDEEQAAYIINVAQTHGEMPIAIQSWDEIAETSVPLVKCFGTQTEMLRVQKNLQVNPHFNLTLIRDPYLDGCYILLITDRAASKGQSLEKMIQLTGLRNTVIAAGDDENDASLLQAADIEIAMAHAPQQLHDIADFIAPPTNEYGIIHALQLALKKNGN